MIDEVLSGIPSPSKTRAGRKFQACIIDMNFPKEDVEKLAFEIYSLYNHRSRDRNPDQDLACSGFASLPDTLKNSNLRQAKDLAEN